MVGGDVQRVEIVVFAFHFRPVEHRESHGDEQVFDLRLNLGDGMQRAGPRAGSWQREVHPFGVQPSSQSSIGGVAVLSFERTFDLLLDGIEQLANRPAPLRCELAHLLADLRERAFAPQHVHPDPLELLRRPGSGNTVESARAQLS